VKSLQDSEPASPKRTGSHKRDDYIDWHEYFMAMAFLAAKRSPQVGAVIVNDEKKIVTTICPSDAATTNSLGVRTPPIRWTASTCTWSTPRWTLYSTKTARTSRTARYTWPYFRATNAPRSSSSPASVRYFTCRTSMPRSRRPLAASGCWMRPVWSIGAAPQTAANRFWGDRLGRQCEGAAHVQEERRVGLVFSDFRIYCWYYRGK
jgi:Cytidine and deoxycytidylate deaminase zinc-binding region